MATFCDFSETYQANMDLIEPRNVHQVREMILFASRHKKKICMVGAGCSQGKQTLLQGQIRCCLRHISHMSILPTPNSSSSTKESHGTNLILRVGAGATWRQVIEFLDPLHLSPATMQSYNDFSIGGSIAVNAHSRNGRCVAASLRRLLVMTPGNTTTTTTTSVIDNGPQIHCLTRPAFSTTNTINSNNSQDLWFSVIGGFGSTAIILEADLETVNNFVLYKQVSDLIPALHVPLFSPGPLSPVELWNAQLIPPHFEWARIFHLLPERFTTVTSISDSDSDSYSMEKAQGLDNRGFDLKMQATEQLLRLFPDLQNLRLYLGPWFEGKQGDCCTRNQELSPSVEKHQPLTKKFSTSILQEYFVPAESYGMFITRIIPLWKSINVLNVSVRIVYPNCDSFLSYAARDKPRFAFVLYICVWRWDMERVAHLTQEMIQVAIDCGGTFYLPYHPWAKACQLWHCYTGTRQAQEWKRVRGRYDPREILDSEFLQWLKQNTPDE